MERPQVIIVQGIHVHKVIKREQNDIRFRFGERGMKMVVPGSRTTSVAFHLEARNDDTITQARIGIEVGERERVNEGRHNSSNPPKKNRRDDRDQKKKKVRTLTFPPRHLRHPRR